MKEMVMSEEDIRLACERIGGELNQRLAKEEKLPLFVCVMKGAMEFMVDLLKNVKVPLLEDFVQVSSYSGLHSTGKITLNRDLQTSIDGRSVIVIEDVVDTGLTMHYLLEHLREIGKPKQIILCALFDKKTARKIEVQVDYCGRVLPDNKFLVGYGLDYKGLYRNLPYVYVPTSEEVEAMDRELATKG